MNSRTGFLRRVRGTQAPLGEVILRLTRVELGSKAVVITILATHLFTLFSFEVDRVGSELTAVLSSIVLAELSFWFYYLISLQLTKQIGPNRIGLVLKVLLVPIAATLLRTLVTEISLAAEGVISEPRVFERLPGDLTLTAILLLAVGYVNTGLQDLRSAEFALKRVETQLMQESRNSKDAAERADRMLRELAVDRLGSQLDELVARLKSETVSQTIAQIRELIEKQVRPLSANLWRDVERQFEAIGGESETGKRQGPTRLIPALDFPVMTIWLLPGANIVVTAMGLVSIEYGLQLAAVMLTMPILAVLFRAGIPESWSPNRILGTLVLMLLTGFAWAPSWFFLYLSIGDSAAGELLRRNATGMLLMAVIPASIWASVVRERIAALQKRQKLSVELERTLALIDQSVWVARRNWSYLVHGTVQGALTVAVSRLSLAEAGDKEAIQTAKLDIQRARDALESGVALSPTLETGVSDLIQTWTGVCEVVVKFKPEVSAALERNQQAAICLLELLKELVSNGYRHGGATLVTAEVGLDEYGDIDLNVTNNGKALEKSQPGIGTEMFEELTRNWKMTSTKGKVQFTASIPLAIRSEASPTTA